MKIKYYAWLRDNVGCDEEDVELPAEITNVAMLVDWLSSRGPHYEEAFEFIEVSKVAVNELYVQDDAPVCNDDEVVFFPPVAGG